MSLFKARDWWSTWAGSEEDFDLGCLCVANIDNDASPSGRDIWIVDKETLVLYNLCILYFTC